MNAILIIILIISVVLLLECTGLCFSRKEYPQPLRTLQKITHGRGPFTPADGVSFLVLVVLGLSLYLFREPIYKVAQKPLALDTSVDSIPLDPNTTVHKRATAVYENEVFGSTINQMLAQYTFIVTDPADNAAVVHQNPPIEDPESISKTVLITLPGAEETLFMTPSDRFNQFAGEYLITARLKSTPLKNDTYTPTTPLLVTTVTQPDSEAQLAHQSYTAADFSDAHGYNTITVPYTQPVTGPLPHITLTATGAGTILLDTITITEVNVHRNTIGTEDLFPDVPDDTASEGYARMADPVQHVPGTMAFGPYDMTLKPGDYTAHFKLKVGDGTTPLPLVRIQTAAIRSGATTQREYSKVLTMQDFLEPNTYQTFTLPITVTQGDVAEFRTYFYGRTKVWLDTITLYPSNVEALEALTDTEKDTLQTLQQEIDLLKNELQNVRKNTLYAEPVPTNTTPNTPELTLEESEMTAPIETPDVIKEPPKVQTSKRRIDTGLTPGQGPKKDGTGQQQFVIQYPEETLSEVIIPSP